MVENDVLVRLRAANRRETEAWRHVQSKADWERFRDARLQALRRSLGAPLSTPQSLNVQVTGTLSGDGFRIENTAFESRPGLVVTANLYIPDPAGEGMPAILICHSHHNPKTQGELQDMGMNWARLGALVLVMDQIGHGERRQQPFGGRQDYNSRSFTGMQLHLIGESLMGWMVRDLMCGVDLLVNRPGVDQDCVILVGSVAGGGDPAAVTAALDTRIACAIPFNFGGPQPETEYPLPADAEDSFNYAGIPELESTRCLRLNARDGFMPWAIVAAIAPRHLIYAHEFSWDRERDPVWQRLRKVFDFYDAGAHLAFAHGWGVLSKRPPEASHCNNVGPPHRRMIYPALHRWFGMHIPEREVQGRLPPEKLTCLSQELPFQAQMVHELAGEIAAGMLSLARAELAGLDPPARRAKLRGEWAHILGDIDPVSHPTALSRQESHMGNVAAERIALEVERGIVVPLLLLLPADSVARSASEGAHRWMATGDGTTHVVLGIAQQGKAQFLKTHGHEVAQLLGNGIAVCLPDLRDTGETATSDARGLRLVPSEATVISPAELMLGQTLVGSRLRDLRAVVRYLRGRSETRSLRMAIWGDGFAPVNPASFEDPPSDSDVELHKAEPMGALLALLAALFEEDMVAVVARRGLVGFASMLASHFHYVPHDVLVPGLLKTGDISDVAAALAPRPLCLEGLVDGRNRVVMQPQLNCWLAPVQQAYAAHLDRLRISSCMNEGVAAWLTTALRIGDR
jgi:dienelactone hydrolase